MRPSTLCSWGSHRACTRTHPSLPLSKQNSRQEAQTDPPSGFFDVFLSSAWTTRHRSFFTSEPHSLCDQSVCPASIARLGQVNRLPQLQTWAVGFCIPNKTGIHASKSHSRQPGSAPPPGGTILESRVWPFPDSQVVLSRSCPSRLLTSTTSFHTWVAPALAPASLRFGLTFFPSPEILRTDLLGIPSPNLSGFA